MVIQRWQSVLLLIASVMMFLFAFCSLGQIQGADCTVNITTMGMNRVGDGVSVVPTIYIFIVALLSAILPLIAIFMYKNLRGQSRVCLITMLLIAADCVCEWIQATSLDIPGGQSVGWSSVVIAPFVAIVALIVARRCIASDRKKLESYDRLR